MFTFPTISHFQTLESRRLTLYTAQSKDLVNLFGCYAKI
jgi:hypothetical protein